MSRILINDGSNRVVLENVLLAKSTVARMRGLLGRRSLRTDSGMLIRPCQSIHMWFMCFPIDAAFLDKDLQVLRIARNLRPWQLAFAPRGTCCVLETATGVLDSINKFDRLSLE
ncbi:DUF192 domain-containing protein [Pontiella sulfatireligans]|uniref:DUF192 domain-containing protein n=1 Tax=Pontiella sulfatireligans TaxID=2750658 RepID=A0A6C2URR2_9BACT|nr:DUF192 domain-containing protein [Pontiella sulfatireligans]VGO22643.1 hypothetical protein SCARR_04738 [Pontiella sulfatireligans]